MTIIMHIGRVAHMALSQLGAVVLFFIKSVGVAFSPPWYFQQIAKQFMQIGFLSLPVVGMTAFCTGMVLAIQSYTGFSRFQAEDAVATVVILSMTRELGPVLAGLMVAGRVGAAMAAEIGTMHVTEQIDALTTLSTSPFRYLVFPRMLAGLVTLPLLVLIADSIGVLGGYVVGVYKLGFNPSNYIEQTIKFLEMEDVISGLIKAAVFGIVISLMGCYHGYNSGRGAEGVGRATTQAVVSASILILILNYALTVLLFTK
jgi:phospholipid/cholesterol/gamma-HCH transport system permease protein